MQEQKDHFPMVIKESLQNCFFICIPSEIEKNHKGLKDPHSGRDFLLASWLAFGYSTFPFILSGNHNPFS